MTDNHNLWEFDESMGLFTRLCGIDEAGRGPLAGPVTAGCVILREGVALPTLNDSKKLTEKRREALYEELTESGCAAYGIGFGLVEEIDSLNILQATFLAMRRAYENMLERNPDLEAPLLALVDGNQNPHLPIETKLVVGGDAKSAHIAAASIIAKVSRDRVMREYAEMYPQYRWEKNKGYGSKEHYELLREHGPSPIHRMSFLKKLYPEGR